METLWICECNGLILFWFRFHSLPYSILPELSVIDSFHGYSLVPHLFVVPLITLCISSQFPQFFVWYSQCIKWLCYCVFLVIFCVFPFGLIIKECFAYFPSSCPLQQLQHDKIPDLNIRFFCGVLKIDFSLPRAGATIPRGPHKRLFRYGLPYVIP